MFISLFLFSLNAFEYRLQSSVPVKGRAWHLSGNGAHRLDLATDDRALLILAAEEKHEKFNSTKANADECQNQTGIEI